MTETAAERPAAPPRGRTGLSARKGGLPVWAWVLGGTVLAGVAFIWYRNRQAAASTSASADTAGTAAAGPATEATTIVPVDQGLTQSQYDALRAQISDLQGEVSREQSAEAKSAKAETAELTSLQKEETAEDKRAPAPKPPPRPKPKRRPVTGGKGTLPPPGGSQPAAKR